eukprot:gnl/MRDRNA2_/MRDRNA2_105234_c0_seq1.p1 gnl/MRDRNA2_/MRDRNA2_105234_c0~~gnl/MRDRNA2_/MRDRNA2_105234_c0_seq1.p1  ORF type:complete len:2126 (-),score=391.10 gnl/MRDRNA2_/MRDRNA2_105234_c0_seq1:24-6287(-)
MSQPPALPVHANLYSGAVPHRISDALNILSGSETLEVSSDETRVIDGAGLPVMHEVSINDLTCLEKEMALTACYFIRRFSGRLESGATEVDCTSVLMDLYACEVAFHEAKWRLVEVYLEALEHITDFQDSRDLAQRIVDVMAERPRLDLDDVYFVDAYSTVTAMMQERVDLFRSVLSHQIRIEKQIVEQVVGHNKGLHRWHNLGNNSAKGDKGDDEESDGEEDFLHNHVSGAEDPQLDLGQSLAHQLEGCPWVNSDPDGNADIRFVPSGSQCDVLHFCNGAALTWRVDLLCEETFRELSDKLHPKGRQMLSLRRACVKAVAKEWTDHQALNSADFMAPSKSSDLLGCEAFEDPTLLGILMEDALQTLKTQRVPGNTANGEGEDDESTMNECDDDDSDAIRFHTFFKDIRSLPGDESALCMYLNLLEHVLVRQKLVDCMLENRILEEVLVEQGRLVSATVSIRSDPIVEFTEFPSHVHRAKAPVRASTKTQIPVNTNQPPLLLAGDIDNEFGNLDLSTRSAIVINCCNARILELRALYQHELANRWLYVLCMVYNSVLITNTIQNMITDDAASWAPRPDVSSGDLAVLIMKRFRRVAQISEPLAQPITTQSAAVLTPPSNEPSTLWITNSSSTAEVGAGLSKFAQLLQVPMSSKAMVRIAAALILRERHGMIKKHCQALAEPAEKELWLRRYKCRLLSYCSLFIGQAACDISVRVQAAMSTTQFLELTLLIPQDSCPFELSTEEKPRPILDREGGVSSIFHIPQTLEVLQMRGTSIRTADVSRGMMEVDSKMPDAFGPDSNANEQQVAILETDYRSPAFLVLSLMYDLTPIVALLFFICSLEGDGCTILKLHRAVKDNLRGVQAARDAVTELLEEQTQQAQCTMEALDTLRIEFMSLASQFKKESEESMSSGAEVLTKLRQRLKAVFLRVGVLLRHAARKALEKDRREEAAELKRWVAHMEGSPVGGGGAIQAPGLMSFRSSFASAFQGTDGPEEVGTTDALTKLTFLENPIRPCATMCGMDAPKCRKYKSLDVAPYYHPYVRALLTAHCPKLLTKPGLNADFGSEYFATAQPPPSYVGCLPWMFPAPPLMAFTRALSCLPSDWRKQVFDLQTQLEMKAEEYLLLRNMTPSQEGALDAEAEMFRTFLVRDELQTCVIRALSHAPVPTTAAALQHFDTYFSANFANFERLEGDTSSGAPPAPDDAGTPAPGGMTVQSTAEDRARNAIRMEMRSECEYLSRMITAMNKWLLMSLIIATEREVEIVVGLESEQQQSIRAVTKAGRGGGGVERAPQVPSHRGALTRTDIVLTFVNRLRARGTRVRTHGASELLRSYVFTERDIRECTEDLGRRLLKWGHAAAVSQKLQAEEGMRRSRTSLENSELASKQNVHDRVFRLHELEAQVESTVADRNGKLYFEIDRLHRVLEEMMSSSREMEHRLHSDIVRSVHEEIAVLEKDVEDVKTRYEEYRKEMLAGVESELKTQRQSLIQKLSSMGASNFALQQKVKNLQDGEIAAPAETQDEEAAGSRRASKASITPQNSKKAEVPVEVEVEELDEGDELSRRSSKKRKAKMAWWATDETQLEQEEAERPILVPLNVVPEQVEPVSGLQNEIAELNHVQVRSKTLYALKFQALRQQFEQMIQALALTLSSNAELWERVAEVREREQLIQTELAKSQRQMASCEETIQVLRTQMETNEDWRQQLQTWKDSVREHLGELENRVERQGKIGSVNIERLLMEHERRDATLKHLETQHDRQAVIYEKEVKERKKLQAKLHQEKSLSEQAEAKASLMRNELERGGYEHDSLVTLWQQQHKESAQRFAELEVQNAEIRARLGIGADGRRVGGPSSDSHYEMQQRQQPRTQPSAGRGAETSPAEAERSLSAAGFAQQSRSPGPGETPRSSSARGHRFSSPRQPATQTDASTDLSIMEMGHRQRQSRQQQVSLEESAAFSIGLSVTAAIPGVNRRPLEDVTPPASGRTSVSGNNNASGRPPVMRAFQTPSPPLPAAQEEAHRPTAGLTGRHGSLVPELLPRSSRRSQSERNTPDLESRQVLSARRTSPAQGDIGVASPTRGTRSLRRASTGTPRFPGVG